MNKTIIELLTDIEIDVNTINIQCNPMMDLIYHFIELQKKMLNVTTDTDIGYIIILT